MTIKMVRTRKYLTRRVVEQLRIQGATCSNQVIDKVIKTLFSQMASVLSEGNGICIHNLGTFKFRHAPTRKRYQPKTDSHYEQEPRIRIAFKPSKKLMRRLQMEYDNFKERGTEEYEVL